jgi:multidrug efflux pump subunit AcrB
MIRALIQGSLARPCTVIVVAMAIVVLGGLCLCSIPVDILPVNNSPAVQVLTFYNGMPAEAVEKNITSRLERQTGQASGRIRQESRSIQGASIVRNYFDGSVDPSGALTQVNSLATGAFKSMPPGTDPSVILPFDPTGTTPVCVIALDSKTQSESTLYDVGRYEVRNMIMGMPGANAPAVHGGKLRAIMAYVDRHKLAARGLSPLAVMEAMDDYNLFVPAGQAQFGDTTYAINSNAMHTSVESMGEIPLRSELGNAAYLEDVATPTDTNFMQSSLVRVDGRRQVYIPVYRQPGASTLSVVDKLRNSLDEMTSRLSRGGIDLKLVMDQSVYVRQAIKSLVEEGVLGAVMCSLVILLFLGNFRMMGIAVMVIPLSVLAAIAGLYATGNSINVMTLAGLSLAIGPLVDLAVIGLENTHRHLKRGAAPPEAALLGANEVATPAFVATCCTLAVLAPLAFLPDLGEFLFRPMALALGFAMIAAFLLSQTLVPNRCAAWLKPEGPEDHGDHEKPPRRRWPLSTLFAAMHAVFAKWEVFFYVSSRRYERGLEFALRHRRTVVVSAMALLGVLLATLGPHLKREFFPEVDSGAFEMTVRAGSGTSLEVTEERVAEVEQLIRESVGEDLQLVMAEVGSVADWSAAYTPNAGPMDAAVKVQLTADRVRTSQEHVRNLRRRLGEDPRFDDLEFGFDTGGMIRTAMNGGKATPINVRVTGKDLEQLRAIAEAVREKVAEVDGVVDARILQRLDYPQYVVDIDRSRAADLGLPLPYVVKNVVAALNSSIQFNKRNFYIDPVTKGQYYVGVQYAEDDIESLDTLLNIPITSPTQGASIPLRNVVTVRRSTVPTEVVHQDLQTGIDLAMAVDGRDLGHVADDVVAVLQQFGVRQPDGTWAPFATVGETAEDAAAAAPAGKKTLDGVRIRLSGEYVRMQDMFKNLAGGLVLATLLVYLLLVILFQSFRLPLVILFAVPLGLIGVVLTLYATGTAVNVQSLLGVIFMVGIVVANTVLLIDYAQNLRREGMTPLEAIRQAASIRMRPILMTALAALLALLPMALAHGRGSEANAPLGRAVIGGLLAGLVTTLLIVPCLYAWMVRDDKPAPEPAATT